MTDHHETKAPPGPQTAGSRRVPEKLRLLGEILAAYVPLLMCLRRNDLQAMVERARGVPPSRPARPPAEGDAYEAAVKLGWIVRRVLMVLPTERRCLIRSLVLIRMLERRRIDNRLVIGVVGGQDFAAHAWVEHHGMPVLPAGRYDRLLEL